MVGDLIFSLIISVLVFLSLIYIFKDQLSNLIVGLRKNKRIKNKLKKFCKQYDYLYLSDLCIRLDAGKYTNIEHVLIADKYIYIIDMKFWLGFIQGNEEDEKWLLSDGKSTIYVDNPLRTSAMKVKILSSILNINEDNFINMVCLAKCGRIKEVNVKTHSSVVLGEKTLLSYVVDNEKNARINVYKSEEVERVAASLYEYHKASLEDKAFYHKHRNKY